MNITTETEDVTTGSGNITIPDYTPTEPPRQSAWQYDGSAASYDEDAVLMTLFVNLGLFVLLLCMYEFFSRMLPRVYRPNQLKVDMQSGTHHVQHLPRPMMQQNSFPFFGWMKHVNNVSWTQLRKTCGLDAYFFVRYIRMCFQVTAVSAVWAMVVLWPTYIVGDNEGAHGLYLISMANLPQGDWKLWIPTVFMYFVTTYIMFVMNCEYKHWIECRQEFLSGLKGTSDVHPQQGYTLMVEDIPHELRSDQALHDYFEELFPNKVHSAKIILHIPDLYSAVLERDRILAKLEKCQAIEIATGVPPTHTVRRWSVKMPRRARDSNDAYDQTIMRMAQPGEKVDSIDYYTRYLAILNDRVAKLQEQKIALATQGDNSVRATDWISHTLGLKGSSSISRESSNSHAAAAAYNSDGGEQQSVEEDGLIVQSHSASAVVRGHTLALLRQVGLDFLCGGFLSMHRQLDAVVDTLSGATMSSTGFVTFKELVTTACAVRAPLSHEAGVLDAQIAPEPRDLKWENAHINRSWSAGRQWTMNLLLVLGAVLWSAVVAAIQALANLESLSQLPGLSGLGEGMSDHLKALVNGFLPVAALLFVIFLLPFVFKWIAIDLERRKSMSDVERSVMNRFFWYQLANVYVTVTAGSVWDALSDILDHPGNAVEILGRAVTTVVGYFIALVITKLLAGLPFVMLRPLALCRRLSQKIFCREARLTQRDLDKQNRQRTLAYGKEVCMGWRVEPSYRRFSYDTDSAFPFPSSSPT
jgi:hypothetical protein